MSKAMRNIKIKVSHFFFTEWYRNVTNREYEGIRLNAPVTHISTKSIVTYQANKISLQTIPSEWDSVL